MPDPANFRYRIPQMLVLSMAAVALYGPFLSSSPVFDDHGFFDAVHPEYGLSLSWLAFSGAIIFVLHNSDAARRDYAGRCQLGVREVCNKSNVRDGRPAA